MSCVLCVCLAVRSGGTCGDDFKKREKKMGKATKAVGTILGSPIFFFALFFRFLFISDKKTSCLKNNRSLLAVRIGTRVYGHDTEIR